MFSLPAAQHGYIVIEDLALIIFRMLFPLIRGNVQKFFEIARKRGRLLKADVVADLSHRHVALAHELARLLDTH